MTFTVQDFFLDYVATKTVKMKSRDSVVGVMRASRKLHQPLAVSTVKRSEFYQCQVLASG